MVAEETELEMVRRHVRQGEAHVSRQIEIIEELSHRNQPTSLAKSLLSNLEVTLRAHRDHLARLNSNQVTTSN